MGVRCLSVHAGYRCRHAGNCCSDTWTIPADEHVIQLVRRRDIDLPKTAAPLLVETPYPELAGRRLVLAHSDGACVFYDRGGRLCTIHSQRGVEALPSACRHFPRVYLRDGRGTFLSLSHFCPTAARMLLDDVEISVVVARAPLALDGEIEALEATETLPPLLRPDMLTDLAGYDAWERAALGTLARIDITHEEALSVIAAATERVRDWQPALGPLDAFVERTFASTAVPPPSGDDVLTDARRLDLVDASCPPGAGHVVRCVVSSDHRQALRAFDAAVKRYLAARLFGSWLAYRGSGLRSLVEWLKICLALLRNATARQSAIAGGPLDSGTFIEAVRECDRVAVHVVECHRLGRELLSVESATIA